MDNIYQFTNYDIDGKPVNLSDYKGKVIMIVNVASKCGHTPQYAELEELYKKYSDKGFVILGFPANDFMFQEPGTNAEIKNFCTLNYGVTFPMFSKIHVRGKEIDPLYKWLTENPIQKGAVKWNFEKFIIDKEGKVTKRFITKIKPLDKEVTSTIEKELAK